MEAGDYEIVDYTRMVDVLRDLFMQYDKVCTAQKIEIPNLESGKVFAGRTYRNNSDQIAGVFTALMNACAYAVCSFDRLVVKHPDLRDYLLTAARNKYEMETSRNCFLEIRFSEEIINDVYSDVTVVFVPTASIGTGLITYKCSVPRTGYDLDAYITQLRDKLSFCYTV